MLPSRNASSGPRSRPTVPQFGVTTARKPLFPTTVSPAEERAREQAENAARRLAEQFLAAMITRSNLRRAHALLSPQLNSATLAEWEQGQDLPLSLKSTDTLTGMTVAFSGSTDVGLVASIATGDSDARLIALRFAKTRDRWLLDYVHAGTASGHIDASNFSPPGFAPGSSRETPWTWLILGLGFAGLIVVVVWLDWRMVRTPRAARNV